MKHALTALCLLTTSLSAQTYQENWESLSQHTAAPEWLKDAKLGIYFHWGLYSVPAHFSEWYPYYLCRPGHSVQKHHIEKYGDPKKVGYHEFTKDFTAEHFDPEEWAQLFADSGARFAGPVAEHHDGFSLWDSDITPWNAADRGPKRDILGQLFTSLRKRDLKTIATFHHARNLQRYPEAEMPETSKKRDRSRWHSHFSNWKGWPSASDDPELQLMYGNMPEEKWLEEVWYGKLKEVIDKYQPDIVWFDSWLDRIPEPYRKKFSAYYLNEAQKWNKDVVIIRKQNDLPIEFTVNDHEKSREPGIAKHLWMTDDTISFGSWCYTDKLRIKPLSVVLHATIDTVSKNGVVLLNLSPKADGTIPDDQRSVLKGLGAWLKKNGEAIYGTRPWVTFGEGPTKEPAGGFKSHQQFEKLVYGPKDIRYTVSKDGKTLYATVLATPETGTSMNFASLTESVVGKPVTVSSLTLLGSDEKIPFEMNAKGLAFTSPEIKEKSDAVVFKIIF